MRGECVCEMEWSVGCEMLRKRSVGDLCRVEGEGEFKLTVVMVIGW